jgi:Ser/Thr protein kinase RdoA (MazF antagonist)
VSRSATLVVVDRDGIPIGTFGPVSASRHPQETLELTEQAAVAGLELTILRLLREPEPGPGDVQHCVYVAQALGPVPARLLSPLGPGITIDDHPLRLRYARPGGVVADLNWADEVLRRRGRRRNGRPRQERTWNLSCVHRLSLDDGTTAWLKVVPAFFAHEGAMLEFMHAASLPIHVPALLAMDGANGRVLLEHVDGPLMWGASVTRWQTVIDAAVATQALLDRHVDELLARGARDWRSGPFLTAIAQLWGRADVRSTLPPAEHAELDRLVDVLPTILDALSACGLPATLVHGDLHQGNVVDSAAGPVVLDWGDACVGHPLLDLPAFCHGLPAADHAIIEARVVAAWRAALPETDPARAAALIKPLTALWKALIYQNFLDHIEPSEHHYHASDVPNWLTEALRRSARLGV